MGQALNTQTAPITHPQDELWGVYFEKIYHDITEADCIVIDRQGVPVLFWSILPYLLSQVTAFYLKIGHL